MISFEIISLGSLLRRLLSIQGSYLVSVVSFVYHQALFHDL